LHSGQRPAHFRLSRPHSLQTYAVRTFVLLAITHLRTDVLE
jgi:hypothetical protein